MELGLELLDLGLDRRLVLFMALLPQLLACLSLGGALGLLGGGDLGFAPARTDREMSLSTDSVSSSSSRSNSDPISSPVAPPSRTPSGPPRIPRSAPGR